MKKNKQSKTISRNRKAAKSMTGRAKAGGLVARHAGAVGKRRKAAKAGKSVARAATKRASPMKKKTKVAQARAGTRTKRPVASRAPISDLRTPLQQGLVTDQRKGYQSTDAFTSTAQGAQPSSQLLAARVKRPMRHTRDQVGARHH